MRRTMVLIATLAAVALPGCLVGHRSGGHVSVGASVEIDHSYTYFPTHHAYYCESCNDWWVIEAGIWTHRRERPQSIVIQHDTPWVVVNVGNDAPHVQYASHSRDYPSSWKPGKSKGPPPGRGWRK